MTYNINKQYIFSFCDFYISLIKSLIKDYKNKKAKCGLLFSHISLFSYYVHRTGNKL